MVIQNEIKRKYDAVIVSINVKIKFKPQHQKLEVNKYFLTTLNNKQIPQNITGKALAVTKCFSCIFPITI